MRLKSLNLPIVLPVTEDRARSVSSLQDGLLRIIGVAEAAVNNAYDSLHLVYDPDLVAFSRLEYEALRHGARLLIEVNHGIYELDTPPTPEEGRLIENTVRAQHGVVWAGFGFTTAHLHIEYQPRRVTRYEIARCITRCGFLPISYAERPEAVGRGANPHLSPLALLNRHRWMLMALLLLLCGLLLARQFRPDSPLPIHTLFYIAATLAGGWSLLWRGLYGLRYGLIGRNLLITLAATGLALAQNWELAAGLVVLDGFRRIVQESQLSGLRQALRTLSIGAMQHDSPLEENAPAAKPTSAVPPTPIHRDMTLAMDINTLQSPQAQEAERPRRSQPQEEVPLRDATPEVPHPLASDYDPHPEPTPYRAAQRLSTALSLHPLAEKRIERAWEKAAVLLLFVAIILALFAPLVGGGDATQTAAFWLTRSVALILAAGPLMSGIIVTVAHSAALGTAWKRGVLCKSSAYLEKIGSARAVVYDKAGTLTTGYPFIEEVVPFNGVTGGQALLIAAAVEQTSPHPIARAIRQAVAASPTDASQLQARDHQQLPGMGVSAILDGQPILIGSQRLFETCQIPLPRLAQEKLAEAEMQGLSVVLLANPRGLLGLFLLNDPVRPEARQVITQLQKRKVVCQALLSGDNGQAVAHIANEIGLNEFEGNLIPEQRSKRVLALKKRYGVTVAVGRGMNSSPTFNTADVSVSLGATENPISLEMTDIALMSDELTALPSLPPLSREVGQTVRSNALFASLSTLGLMVLALTSPVPVLALALAEMLVTAWLLHRSIRLFALSPATSTEASTLETTTSETLLELVIVNDPTVDEKPTPGFAYPTWEQVVVPFTGQPIRFGRKSPSSGLPLQIEDEGMSRLHGEIRLEGRRPVVVDLRSTNGIRRNGITLGALIPPEKPTPLRFGDTLLIGRNTRIEVRAPASATASVPVAASATATAGGSGRLKPDKTLAIAFTFPESNEKHGNTPKSRKSSKSR